ncbi:eukaryotic translation initiation factor 2 beta subunit [Histoplasma capsulatum G186AR]|uniref:Eukaryotic translation initiation factor 2 beta subunit n=2 Tax=Ajellomyces capsulatus TaxID=5037 RepID=C0NAT3_AJECG|nr:eukaryotic translation initiation factor 2 beta subunit [Histoplasma capsulatum G186AR]EEH10774.1 eukaryotic translation initiation factor 2 beta subunit [Histoplasma capsulatum G186AR]KAG5288655.1 eukaryotic translation initiation factor 2 beta subunit [Histoplasma capsulatum]QSS71230.1 eukaryotic translation initiation factor 2 beta subunit [Histoplasma capsulatum G186AR]
MADADAPLVEKKHRKSVAFSEGTTIMDANGAISEASHSDDKTTAERHTATSPDKEVDEVTELFKGLSKKKKTKKTKDADAEANADGEFDPSMMKKKKKSSKKAADGDFEAKLAEAGLASEETAPEEKPSTEEIVSDIENGRGIWAHNATQSIPYNLLVTRFFTLIHSHHPDILSSGSKSYKIPPPQCLREGNRRTIFANITDICKRMKRSEDHVMQFLFAELVTSGSVDGSRRLVIKGRFQQKQIENVLRRYIVEYVTCKTCRSPDTELNKGENRLYFVTCNSCGSRRSVTAIKTGFRGQVGRRKKQQG